MTHWRKLAGRTWSCNRLAGSGGPKLTRICSCRAGRAPNAGVQACPANISQHRRRQGSARILSSFLPPPSLSASLARPLLLPLVGLFSPKQREKLVASYLFASVSRNSQNHTFVRNSEILLVNYFSFAYPRAKQQLSCFVHIARNCIYRRTCTRCKIARYERVCARFR
jgi:hypothetical protein